MDNFQQVYGSPVFFIDSNGIPCPLGLTKNDTQMIAWKELEDILQSDLKVMIFVGTNATIQNH
jgi:hypothetical protein